MLLVPQSRRIPNTLVLRLALVVPNELDAEMCAKRTLIGLRGAAAYESYRASEEASYGETAQRYFAEFERVAAAWPGSIDAQVRLILGRNPARFRRELNRLNSKGKFRRLDLDAWLSG